MDAPFLDDDLSFLEGVEDLAIEQFVSEASVEALDVPILPSLARQALRSNAEKGDPGSI